MRFGGKTSYRLVNRGPEFVTGKGQSYNYCLTVNETATKNMVQ